MSYSVVINLTAAQETLFENLADEKNALELLALQTAALEDSRSAVALIPAAAINPLSARLKAEAVRLGFEPVELSSAGNESLITALESIESDLLVLFQGDAPFVDILQTKKMIAAHERYGVQFSNGDGYPEGLLPEIISSEILLSLKALTSREAASKLRLDGDDSFFSLIMLDINQFDIETVIAQEDYSLLRVRLLARGLRETLLCRELAPMLQTGWSDASLTAEGCAGQIAANPGILRNRPAYYHLQITGQCPQKCSYCPWPAVHPGLLEKGEEMSPALLQELVKQASEFSGEAVVSFSLWGEPSLHSKIEEMIQIVLNQPKLKLLIETSGIGWNSELLEKLAQSAKGRLIWIVSLDSDDPVEYRRLRGEGFEEAQRTAVRLTQLFGEDCYIQAVRMKEGEEKLVEFWKRWNRDGRALVQKYDHFCGFLPERKVVDLSPLNRFPCWHLKRDLVMMSDGRVLICREDVEAKNPLGRFPDQTVKTLFNAGNDLYMKHCSGETPGICGGCDEYYTYNF